MLLAVGMVGWLLLGYGIPLALITSTARRPSLDQVNGTWFIWAVATQSVAVAVAALSHLVPGDALAASAMACWAVGLVQYLLIAGMALARLLLRSVSPRDLAPSYWVFMGAAAISVLAGARLLELPARGAVLPHPVITGLTIVLWSFCTWLIPLLLALGSVAARGSPRPAALRGEPVESCLPGRHVQGCHAGVGAGDRDLLVDHAGWR